MPIGSWLRKRGHHGTNSTSFENLGYEAFRKPTEFLHNDVNVKRAASHGSRYPSHGARGRDASAYVERHASTAGVPQAMETESEQMPDAGAWVSKSVIPDEDFLEPVRHAPLGREKPLPTPSSETPTKRTTRRAKDSPAAKSAASARRRTDARAQAEARSVSASHAYHVSSHGPHTTPMWLEPSASDVKTVSYLSAPRWVENYVADTGAAPPTVFSLN